MLHAWSAYSLSLAIQTRIFLETQCSNRFQELVSCLMSRDINTDTKEVFSKIRSLNQHSGCQAWAKNGRPRPTVHCISDGTVTPLVLSLSPSLGKAKQPPSSNCGNEDLNPNQVDLFDPTANAFSGVLLVSRHSNPFPISQLAASRYRAGESNS